jgi:O-antigen/teichoic acid export membrane protein
MSLVRKLLGETVIYGLSGIVGRFLNMLLVPFYTRVLQQTNDYGVVIDLYATAAFVMILLSYRMESAFFRFGTPPEDREKVYSTGMISLLTSTGIITALLLLFAQPIATFLAYEAHPEYIRWFALILALDCLAELPFARLRLEQKPLKFASIKLINIFVNIGANLFWLVACPYWYQQGATWVLYCWTPGNDVAYIFLSNLLASSITLLLLAPQLTRTRWHFHIATWRSMLAYAAPLIVVGFAGIVDEMFSRSMLKFLLPGTTHQNLSAVGIFGANYKLAALITLFNQAYRYAAEPFFFRHAQAADARTTQAEITKWFTIASATGVLFVLVGIDLFRYFIDEKYWSGLKVVPILLMANLLLGLYYNFSVWYRLKDRTGLGAWISVAGAVLTIGLNLLLIPTCGYTGAAWVTLLCYAFMSAATWYTGSQHYPVPYNLRKLIGYPLLAIGLWQLQLHLNNFLDPHPAVYWSVKLATCALFP